MQNFQHLPNRRRLWKSVQMRFCSHFAFQSWGIGLSKFSLRGADDRLASRRRLVSKPRGEIFCSRGRFCDALQAVRPLQDLGIAGDFESRGKETRRIDPVFILSRNNRREGNRFANRKIIAPWECKLGKKPPPATAMTCRDRRDVIVAMDRMEWMEWMYSMEALEDGGFSPGTLEVVEHARLRP